MRVCVLCTVVRMQSKGNDLPWSNTIRHYHERSKINNEKTFTHTVRHGTARHDTARHETQNGRNISISIRNVVPIDDFMSIDGYQLFPLPLASYTHSLWLHYRTNSLIIGFNCDDVQSTWFTLFLLLVAFFVAEFCHFECGLYMSILSIIFFFDLV